MQPEIWCSESSSGFRFYWSSSFTDEVSRFYRWSVKFSWNFEKKMTVQVLHMKHEIMYMPKMRLWFCWPETYFSFCYRKSQAFYFNSIQYDRKSRLGQILNATKLVICKHSTADDWISSSGWSPPFFNMTYCFSVFITRTINTFSFRFGR
jgi:hypothetical protein